MVAIHALEGGLVHSYSWAMLNWDALREALQTALLEAVSAEAGGRGALPPSASCTPRPMATSKRPRCS